MAVINDGDTTITLFQGNGDGSFTKTSDITGLPSAGGSQVRFSVETIQVDDFNNDGNLDLFYNSAVAPWTGVSLGNGNGTFQPSLPGPAVPWQGTATIGDLNNDGKKDFLTTGDYGQVQVGLGNGDGTFSYIGGSGAPGRVTLGDFNNDGKLDKATAGWVTDNASTELGNGDGTFQPATSYTLGNENQTPLTIDLNGDGNLDLLIPRWRGIGIAFFAGNGDGTLSNPIIYPVTFGGHMGQLIAADFNNDGFVDIAGNNGFTDFTNVFLNQSTWPKMTIDITGVTSEARPSILNLSSGPNGDAISLTLANLQEFFDQFSSALGLDDVDKALGKISAERANIGASISALTFTVDNLTTLSTKTQEAMSRIQDTDYAVATTELAKRQIIQQAAMAMMAQANQNPQVILQLLKSTTS